MVKIRGMFEFNCATCGHYKVITSPSLYKFKKNALYCCSYTCFEKLKERLKNKSQEIEL